ncbi:hydrolase [Dactylosporangium roseum]|uniref:Hydrolase n=1 Tax=Dactylosporangium roseum TaxID=47989 RepID=A0ABY5Z1U6_9ACTN|nr:hydrolase [Dactylosporangium roseum]UWZ35581.1 hydrolase [Dactylosporangium roseum]
MIDLSVDGHVHTAFSSGRDSVSVLVAAAEQAGLTEVTFADRVGPDTSWLPPYLASIQRAQQRTDVVLRRGVEVEAIGIDGWLAFPSDLNGLEVISVGIDRLPLPAGLLSPDAVRGLIDNGTMRALDVIDQVVAVTGLAVERVSRYAPTRLARPLDFLARAGIDESAVPDASIAELVEACRVNGTVIEISERHRLPGRRLVQACVEGGVRLVPASDAVRAGEVGVYRYVREIVTAVANTPAAA